MVVFPVLRNAYRESFSIDGVPVEAFVHDPETLEYFCVDVDRPCGIPALAQMVLEGLEIPEPNDLSNALKDRARSFIEAGPPALEGDVEQRMRYAVTDLLDDLRAPRSRDELLGAGSRLFETLADYYLRSQGLWSARGKAIARALQRADPAIAANYSRCFDALFSQGDVGPVIQLTEHLLAPRGGALFDGYKADAPPEWRRRR